MKGALLTQFALQANNVADTFRAAFAQMKLGDSIVDLTAPEESTRGGERALQHVRLKRPSGLAVVIGRVDLSTMRGELHSYAAMASAFETRFREAPGIDEASYAAFVERAREVLAAFGISLDVTDAAPPVSMTMARGTPPRWPLLLFVAALIAVLGVAALIAFR